MSAVYHDYVNIAPAYLGGVSGAAVADNLVRFPVPYKCQVRRAAILWGTAGAAQAVVEFDRRITPNSDTGRTLIASITKPAAESLGKYIYKDPTTSIVLNEGDQVVVEVTDLEAASTFEVVLLVERMPEQPANQADMLASV